MSIRQVGPVGYRTHITQIATAEDTVCHHRTLTHRDVGVASDIGNITATIDTSRDVGQIAIGTDGFFLALSVMMRASTDFDMCVAIDHCHITSTIDVTDAACPEDGITMRGAFNVFVTLYIIYIGISFLGY